VPSLDIGSALTTPVGSVWRKYERSYVFSYGKRGGYKSLASPTEWNATGNSEGYLQLLP